MNKEKVARVQKAVSIMRKYNKIHPQIKISVDVVFFVTSLSAFYFKNLI